MCVVAWCVLLHDVVACYRVTEDHLVYLVMLVRNGRLRLSPSRYRRTCHILSLLATGIEPPYTHRDAHKHAYKNCKYYKKMNIYLFHWCVITQHNTTCLRRSNNYFVYIYELGITLIMFSSVILDENSFTTDWHLPLWWLVIAESATRGWYLNITCYFYGRYACA